jgi:hypothetical protein
MADSANVLIVARDASARRALAADLYAALQPSWDAPRAAQTRPCGTDEAEASQTKRRTYEA